ncbi:MAG: hypothetical protein Q8L74_17220 [Nitrospirota bacterium]|nr:hypothetical protein [Nitrospirota bacterium]
MRRQKIALLVVILLGVAGALILLSRAPSPIEQTALAAVPRPFVVFDATLFKNKPSLAADHVRPLTILYESRLFVANQPPTAVPSEVIVRSLAYELRASTDPVILDIERWPLTGDRVAVASTVAKYLSVLSWVKGEAPAVPFGLYGTVPIPDYWRASSGPISPQFLAWRKDNDRLAQIVDHVDALYPSIYTFYPDRQAWVAYAKAQIAEARRLAKGKPVYGFLWPLYHNQGNESLGPRPIEPDYWDLQLTTMAQHADGVVIWGGWGDHGPEPWSEEAPWWQVTKRFMQRLGPSSLSSPTDVRAQ